jgi:hypothetical protein
MPSSLHKTLKQVIKKKKIPKPIIDDDDDDYNINRNYYFNQSWYYPELMKLTEKKIRSPKSAELFRKAWELSHSFHPNDICQKLHNDYNKYLKNLTTLVELEATLKEYREMSSLQDDSTDDGNCFFHAIIQFKHQGINFQVARKRTAEWIASHLDHYSVFDTPDNRAIDVKKNGVFANNTAIQAYADVSNTTIFIHKKIEEKSKEEYVVIVHPDETIAQTHLIHTSVHVHLDDVSSKYEPHYRKVVITHPTSI